VISAAQAAEYLDSQLGIGLPAFLLSAACEEVEALESAMADAGYSESTITLLQCMCVALVAVRGDSRRIASQGAPSGASRSFKYGDKDLSALRRSLAAMDTAGITSALVGPDPTNGTLLLVV
jgi:hypothetical protein